MYKNLVVESNLILKVQILKFKKKLSVQSRGGLTKKRENSNSIENNLKIFSIQIEKKDAEVLELLIMKILNFSSKKKIIRTIFTK